MGEMQYLRRSKSAQILCLTNFVDYLAGFCATLSQSMTARKEVHTLTVVAKGLNHVKPILHIRGIVHVK